jgi:ATP-binding cassette subfamily B protein
VQSQLASVVSRVAVAHQALIFFEHYREVTEATDDLPEAPSRRAMPTLRHGIEFRNVWFRYDDAHEWVLKDVNLFIPHGRAVALVGHNGAGKSTLVKLLCRFYDPTRGAVFWDGIDLRDLPIADLRARIGAVFQDFMQYELTAGENIGVGDVDGADLLDADEPSRIARIHTAAERAGVHDLLNDLPKGYRTLLSRIFTDSKDRDNPETGVLLSGGQWQRVALARAFLRDRRDLLILDEPTSGLDAESEHAIHSRLAEHRRGRTSLLISHRLGAVRDSDEIIVLSESRVVERGTHDALVAGRGIYARLFRLQSAGYTGEARELSARVGPS